MASSSLLGFLAMLLIILPMTARADITDDIFEKVCEQVECGKGKCVVNSSYPLRFFCQCDSGWKRTTDNDTYANSFLPCVIPDCTLNYDRCQPAPPPAAAKSYPLNISTWDPCNWAYCGGGACAKNTTYTYRCECNPNYFNLLNVSVFPCYSACTIGSDCSGLGIIDENATSNQSDGTGQGSSLIPARVHWIVMLMMSAGLVM